MNNDIRDKITKRLGKQRVDKLFKEAKDELEKLRKSAKTTNNDNDKAAS